ncbi:helix-turn-helix domain-containing protein [Luteimicrobium sp. DT211]|uniref:helix-turn-helix domain-containing protein n=1 Tax=Luteimicrobium sp. DT211 TaxID=3393412 RepID=UPI003CEABAED
MSGTTGQPLGPMLRRLRQAGDLTLEALSAASGVSDRTLSDIERGAARGPQHRTMLAVVDALGLAPADREAMLSAAREGRRRGQSEASWALPLPAATPDFTGRAAELARLAERLRGADGPDGLVGLVVGPPGYGKTTLAVEAARRAAHAFDDVLFLRLGGHGPAPLGPDAAAARLIRALTGSAAAHSEDRDRLRALLASRRVLVVLDDATSEAQVRGLLPGSGGSAVLATSRGSLAGLESVDRLHLERMPEDDARALLRRLVPGQQPEADDLTRLTRLCDAVPLALRIAGNRIGSRPGWTVAHLADELARADRRLDVLVAGDLQVRAAVSLSYEQLAPAAKRLFERLALIDGASFGSGLAALVADAGPARADAGLEELLALGLVQTAAGDRFALHDLVRLFAHERLVLRAGTEPERVRADADERVLRTAVRAGRWFEPEVQGEGSADPAGPVPLETRDEARSWLVEEADTWLPALRRAAQAGRHALVLDVADSLHWFSDLWGYWPRWREVYALAVRAAEASGEATAVATHSGYLAWACVRCCDDPVAGAEAASRSRRVAEELGDRDLQGWAWFYLAWCARSGGRAKEAVTAAREARRLLASAQDREGLPQTYQMEARALAMLGRPDEALTALQESVSLALDPSRGPRGQVARLTALHAAGSMVRLAAEAEDWEVVRATVDEPIDGFAAEGAEALAARLYLYRARARRALLAGAGAGTGSAKVPQGLGPVDDITRAAVLFRSCGDLESAVEAETLRRAWLAPARDAAEAAHRR